MVEQQPSNHLSGSRTLSPIAKIYNRYSYFDEMRTALERYEEHLFTAIFTDIE